MRKIAMTTLGALALGIGLAAPAGAVEPVGSCPPGGGWELTQSDGTQFDVVDRNEDGFVCVREFNNEHVPHNTVFRENSAPA